MAQPAFGPDPEKLLSAALHLSNLEPKPGDSLHIAIAFNVQKPWYAYDPEPGDGVSIGTTIDLKLPPGWTVAAPIWPKPVKKQLEGLPPSNTHGGQFIVRVPVTIAKDAAPPFDLTTIAADITFQLCSDVCLPPATIRAVPPPESLRPFTTAPAAHPAAEPVERAARLVRVRLETTPAQTPLQKGQTFPLIVHFDIADSWHIYSKDEGTPTEINLRLPPHLKAGTAQWPPTKPYDVGGQTVDVYFGKIAVTIPIEVVGPMPETTTLEAEVGFTACDVKECLAPYYQTIQLELDNRAAKRGEQAAVISTPPTPSPPQTGAPARSPAAASPNVLWILLLAFAGGLILNLMPCVLPVLSIKVLSFVNQAGESSGRVMGLNLAYSVGVISVFAAIGALASVAKPLFGFADGDEINQSVIFTNPPLVIGLSVAVLAMSLWLLGVFEINVPGFITSAAGGGHREGYGAAFSNGILATMLGIPCVGPFMGTALAYSVIAPPIEAFLVWFVMGLGMASPFILLAFNPTWTRFLPRPGEWMITLKQVMGFLLLGTVVFLLHGLGMDGEILFATMLLFCVSVALWVYGKFSMPHLSVRSHRIAAIVAATLTLGGGYMSYASTRPDPTWIKWSTETMGAHRSQVRLVDFTANWCLICKVNKAQVFDTDPIIQAVRSAGGVRMLADYTNREPSVHALLTRLAPGSSVPVVAIYPANADEPTDVFVGPVTQSQILGAIQRARNP